MPSSACFRDQEADTHQPAQGHPAGQWQPGLKASLSHSRSGALFCSVPCLPPLSLYQWNFKLALPRFHDNCPKAGSPPGSQVGCGLGPNLQGLISPWRKVDSDICAGAPVPPHAQLQLALCAGVCAHQRQPTSGYPPTISGRSAPSFLPGPPQLLGPQGSPQWIHKNFQGPAKLAGISTLSTEQRFLFLQKRGSTARVCAHSPLGVCVCTFPSVCVCVDIPTCVCLCVHIPICVCVSVLTCFFFKYIYFIYLFLAALGLRCCTRAFL